MASLTVKSVTKTYANNSVLHGVDVDIADGEFVILVGPSGCGKSTLLRMIAGLETTSGGEIRIGDRLVNNLAPKDRDIAMVFQGYALYPHMTVAQNMGFSLKLKGRPKAEIDAAVNHAANILSLTNLLDRTPKQLSGGQRSASQWAGRSSAIPKSSCSMNPCRISTQNSVFTCGPRSRSSINGLEQRLFM